MRIKSAGYVLGLAVGLWLCGTAEGGVIAMDAGDFTVLAGRDLSVASGAAIVGHTGAGRTGWTGQSVNVSGNLYTGSGFNADQSTAISGGLVAGGNVWLDRDTTIGGSVHITGTYGADRNVASGSVAASGNIWLDREAQIIGDLQSAGSVGVSADGAITGNVIYGTGYNINASTSVGGQILQGSVAPDTWTLNDRAEPTLNTSGRGSDWYARNSDITLDPGDYGSLSVDRDSVIRLSAGEYNFSSVWIDRNTHVIADAGSGQVIVNIIGSFSTGREVELAGGDLLIRSGGNMSIGRDSTVDAHLQSFNDLSLDRDISVTGSLYAQRDLWLDSGVNVSGEPVLTPGGGNGVDVPEPASVALFSIAALVILPRRR